MGRSWQQRRWARLLFEYVGNVEVAEGWPEETRAPWDRRSNHHARELVEWFKQEMADRRLSPAQETELLNGVRDAVRMGEIPSSGSDLPEEVDRE